MPCNPLPGCVVSMMHQEVVLCLARALSTYTARERIGHVITSPADIPWSGDVLVQPDVFVCEIDGPP